MVIACLLPCLTWRYKWKSLTDTDMLMRLTNNAFNAYLDLVVEPIVIC